MKPSGKKSHSEKNKLSVNGRPFTERFMKSDLHSENAIRINTDSILVFPDLEQKYTIIKELSAGGNAVVYLAEDRFLKREVVLKSLRSSFLADPTRRRAFIREAQLMAQLEHPSIAPVHGIAKDSSGGLFIIMKPIRGESLRDLLKSLRESYVAARPSNVDERKSLHERLELFLHVCDAVAFAHSKHVLHGDLKPGNVMVEHARNVYVMDWGNATIFDENASSELKDSISGTPSYLSPEVVRGENADYRSEVFTLGLILFEVVTLSKAVTGKTTREVLLKIRDGKRKPIRHKFGFPIVPGLREILKKSLHPDREKRYKSVAEFAEELRNFLILFNCKSKD